jgi:hypothetical protein
MTLVKQHYKPRYNAIVQSRPPESRDWMTRPGRPHAMIALPLEFKPR